ncbi:MAG: PrgI family protein [Angelakisella sp.]
MPYVTVPHDLSKVKSAVIMGLTKRQLICITGAGTLALLQYFCTMRTLGEWAVYLAIVPAIPLFWAGFWRSPDGRTPEKVILNYIKVRYQRPRIRPYQTENFYNSLALMAQIQEVIERESKTADPEAGKHEGQET